jgi:hypothetical protein
MIDRNTVVQVQIMTDKAMIETSNLVLITVASEAGAEMLVIGEVILGEDQEEEEEIGNEVATVMISTVDQAMQDGLADNEMKDKADLRGRASISTVHTYYSSDRITYNYYSADC